MTIADEQRRFYEQLFEAHGDDPRALSARDAQTHALRFASAARLFDGVEGSVDLHEVGCGLGHFGRWLQQQRDGVRYSGSDLCEPFLERCRAHFPDGDFVALDASEQPLPRDYDWVVLIGVFNIRLERSDEEWFNFVQRMMERMFTHARRGISVDFLTPFHDPTFARDDLYYQPIEPLLNFVQQRLSRHFELEHRGPLFEYTLRIWKGDEISQRHPGEAFDRYFPERRS